MNKTFRFLGGVRNVLAEDAPGSLPGAPPAWQQGHQTLQNFYSSRAMLPQGQSSEQLAGWLSRHHARYNLSSWCFYGHLKDHERGIAAISSIVQCQMLPSASPYVAEWSYCGADTDGYVLAPFEVEATNVEYSSPFAITVDCNPLYGGFITLSLASGRIGERGAKYRMTGRVVTLPIDAWEYELLMTDTLGCVQVGYGPSSFLPQWLTQAQREAVEASFGGSVHAYLKDGSDDMVTQGSYYYSLPLLKVDNFSLRRNGAPYSSGTDGNIWVDYVVQSFDQAGITRVSGATWQFFGIQFPEIPGRPGYQAAIMVSIVTVPSSSSSSEPSMLPVARFYDGDGPLAQNGAREATFEWTIDQIDFQPKKSWGKFPVEVEISLKAPDATVTIFAKAVRDEQLVADKYEGVFEVCAQFAIRGMHAQDVRGFAWGEVH